MHVVIVQGTSGVNRAILGDSIKLSRDGEAVRLDFVNAVNKVNSDVELDRKIKKIKQMAPS